MWEEHPRRDQSPYTRPKYAEVVRAVLSCPWT